MLDTVLGAEIHSLLKVKKACFHELLNLAMKRQTINNI